MRRRSWPFRWTRGLPLLGLFLLGAASTLDIACNRQPPPPPPPPPAPPELPRPVYTQSQVDALLFGMSYPEVVAQFGAEADRQESTYSEGDSDYVQPYIIAWYIWENEDGSFIKLGFVDKKLAEKTSESLPN